MKYFAFMFSFIVCSSIVAADGDTSTDISKSGVRVCGNAGVPTTTSPVYGGPPTARVEGWQLFKHNGLRLSFGGGTPIAFGDLLAHADGDRHGDRFSALMGSFKLTTLLFEGKNVSLDTAIGPEFMGAINGKEGTTYGAGLDFRGYYTGLRKVQCPVFSKLQPFLTIGSGFNYSDENLRNGGTKFGLPLKAGAGVKVLLNERWSASAEYDLYHLTGFGENFFDYGYTSHGTSTDMFMVGVEFKM